MKELLERRFGTSKYKIDFFQIYDNRIFEINYMYISDQLELNFVKPIRICLYNFDT